jgi:hypothetical protein
VNVTIVGDFSKLDTSKHTPEERMLRTFKNVFQGIGFQKEAKVRLVDYRCGTTKLEASCQDLIIVYQCRDHTIDHPDPEKAKDWCAVTSLMSKFRIVI